MGSIKKTLDSRSLEMLLQGTEYTLRMGSAGVNIKDIFIDFVTADSRNVLVGALFVAIRGGSATAMILSLVL